MRRPYPVVVILGLLAAVALLAAARELSVQVREGHLRDRPSFLGRVQARLPYGDRVTLLAEQGAWMQVRADAGEGWLHRSALTEKRIVLQAGDRGVEPGREDDEIALAGKGFSADVERAYRREHAGLDFTWVDRMEGWIVSAEESAAFLQAGGVRPPEAGR